jgi:Leucine-rich repeat (LRR) protein
MISKIYSNISSLSSLEILVLSNNKLEELPDEFMKLTDLKNLHSNNFSLFPVQVC